MSKKLTMTIMVLAVLVLLFPGFVCGAIPASERAALIALYNTTNGDNWNDTSGWKTPPLHTDGFAMPGTEGNWFGIYLSEDHVDVVYFHRNHLKGTLPSQLGNLTHLRGLVLEEDYLSGSIPSELGDLANLEALYLSDNQLSGSIPTELSNLSNLVYLDLKNNQLSGSIPYQLGNLSKLEEFYLVSNQLSGSIPSQLGNLSKLKVLHLVNNKLNGGIPSQLGNLSNLEDIDLSVNHLGGSIPSQLGNLSKLKSLVLSANWLSGSIPSQLGNLSNLEWFDLSSNFLSGSIPSELGALRNLGGLELADNQLSGSIPSQLGNLSNLEYLGLSDNQLTGSIPSQIGNLSKLKWLYLQNNQLSGSIPSQLGNLSKLYWLFLDHNLLGGLIPSSFIQLTNMYKLSIGYNCLSATDSELRAWLDTYDPDWEAHQDHCGNPRITLSKLNLYFGSNVQSSTSAQTVLIGNSGSGTLNWSAAANVSWLSLNPSSGIGAADLAVSVNPAGLAVGTYPGTISITDPHASNSPQTIAVQLQIYNPGTTTVAFGNFATPLEGSSTFSSVPVTGWALDDIGVAGVKIYNGDAYIGDAVFIEGARPDIEQAYPDYPNNYKAGWGYMLLTNFLPAGGNGTYTLIAKAMDMEGNEVTLGTKTITIDNAHAVKPFGAIDSPGQGGTASGSTYRNQGWVLTPQPNQIPTNGSTIDVWIDGVKQGHPTYNIYRSDVAALFPGYANSNGAAGYFDFDTTAYDNGVHSIFWTAADSAGNSDGIGSRYFTIQNLNGTSEIQNTNYKIQITNKLQSPNSKLKKEEVSFGQILNASGEALFTTDRWPLAAGHLLIQKGYNPNSEPGILSLDENGRYDIEIEELERVVIYLEDQEIQCNAGEYKKQTESNNGFIDDGINKPDVHQIFSNIHLTPNTQHLTLKNTPSNHCKGYLVSGAQLKPLPIGSTLDGERGIFYWQPGPGFLGRFSFVFLLTDANGETFKKFIDITIVPKFDTLSIEHRTPNPPF